MLVRLSKVMAERGMCSRREADYFIERGWVLVDGKRIDQLGIKVDRRQTIVLDTLAQRRQAHLTTVLLNKPVGYVSSPSEKGYPTAASLIVRANLAPQGAAARAASTPIRQLAPAGRLDIDSHGLLVLTQDGRIAKQLIGPGSDIEKEYLVRVRGGITRTKLATLRGPLELDGRTLRPVVITQLGEDRLRFVMREGRKRQIRRMCQLVGLEVTSLQRLRIGNVRLGRLPLGKWRHLRANENF